MDSSPAKERPVNAPSQISVYGENKESTRSTMRDVRQSQGPAMLCCDCRYPSPILQKPLSSIPAWWKVVALVERHTRQFRRDFSGRGSYLALYAAVECS